MFSRQSINSYALSIIQKLQTIAQSQDIDKFLIKFEGEAFLVRKTGDVLLLGNLGGYICVL